ncbi:hypothetical protein LZ32DRAFT_194361 [Colletotrichum eremochloae]|nr:hypothetical protein LZ32DRAFT_194361 [Colletotrichum eremochloae]
MATSPTVRAQSRQPISQLAMRANARSLSLSVSLHSLTLSSFIFGIQVCRPQNPCNPTRPVLFAPPPTIGVDISLSRQVTLPRSGCDKTGKPNIAPNGNVFNTPSSGPLILFHLYRKSRPPLTSTVAQEMPSREGSGYTRALPVPRYYTSTA